MAERSLESEVGPSAGSRLYCLDSVLIDVVLELAHLPERAGDVRARSQLITTGGGFNAMSAAARLGQRVLYAGRLGTGPFAARAEADLAREGIDAPVEREPSLDTGLCVVLVEPDGERTFVTAAGAESRLRASDLAGLAVGAGDAVLVSGYNVMYPGLADVVLAWLSDLDAGVRVAFDQASRAADVPESYLETTLARADWLLCNAAEAEVLSGEADPVSAASALARGDRGVVVRDGRRGCVVASAPEATARVAGFPVRAVDTNGAGDVHNGVFLAEVMSGADAMTAARWANAAASIAVGRRGPATGPDRKEIARRLASG